MTQRPPPPLDDLERTDALPVPDFDDADDTRSVELPALEGSAVLERFAPEYAELAQERDALERSCAELGRERDGLAARVDELARERDRLVARLDQRERELAELRASMVLRPVAGRTPAAPAPSPAPAPAAVAVPRDDAELRELRRANERQLEALAVAELRLGVLLSLLDEQDREHGTRRRGVDAASLPPPREAPLPVRERLAELQRGLQAGGVPQSVPHAPARAVAAPVVRDVPRRLVLLDGGREVVHPLSPRTTIGRTPENDIAIDATYVSRRHAVVHSGPGQTIVEDLNSTNGVVVNGRRVTREKLRDGDIVAIGKSEFRFEDLSSRRGAAP